MFALVLTACSGVPAGFGGAPSVDQGRVTTVEKIELPPGPASGPDVRSVSFADPSHGWILFSDNTAALTTDGGATWKLEPLGFTPESIRFSTATLGWARTANSVLMTRDGGQTWGSVNTAKWPSLRATFINERDGWSLAAPGDLESTQDGGTTWSHLTWPCPDKTGPYSFINANTGWILCGFQEGSGSMSKQLFRTDDGGKNWRKLTEALADRRAAVSDLPGSLRTADYVGSLFFLDEQNGWYTGSRYGDLMVTHDGGLTWWSSPTPVLQGASVAFFNANDGYRVGWTANGNQVVIVTRDGGKTWSQVYPTPVPRGSYYAVDEQTAFGAGLLTDPGAVLKTVNGGRTWRQVGSLPGQTVDALRFMDAREGWAFTERAGGQRSLLQTHDGGVTWSLTAALPASPRIEQVSFVDSQTAFLWDETDKLYVTHDGGATLTPLQVPPGKGFSHDNFQFISPQTGWIVRDSKLFATNSGGQSWKQVPLDSKYEAGFVALTPDGRAWVVASDQGAGVLLATADQGKNWTRYDLGPITLSHVWAGCDGSVWVSDSHGVPSLISYDGGQTWREIPGPQLD